MMRMLARTLTIIIVLIQINGCANIISIANIKKCNLYVRQEKLIESINDSRVQDTTSCTP